MTNPWESKLPSPTALATTFMKKCENPDCPRGSFETNEPFKLYCSLRCRDHAARKRRRLAEKLKDDGHDPRLGSTMKEREQVHKEAAIALKNDPGKSDEFAIKFLFDAVVNKGLTHLMTDPSISQTVRTAVNKMLIARAEGHEPATPSGSYIVQEEGSESVLKELGLIKGDQPTEQVVEVPLTDEEKAREL